MKKRFTILIAAAVMLLTMAAQPITAFGQSKSEVVAYTLDGTITGGSSGYATESEITQNSITWKVMANTTMNPWRFGGKSLDGVDRPMYSTNSISGNITQFVVYNGSATIQVNSMTLIVSPNADFSNPVSEIVGSWNAGNTTVFARPIGVDWTDMYYKLVYNLTNSVNSNKYAEFKKALLYKEDESSVATPTFSPNGGNFTSAQSVTISCETSGASIYYTTNGETPTSNSTPYTGPISVTTTTTIKAIAYVGTEASSLAAATFNILTPVTIAEARAQATGSVVTTMGTVTSAVGTTGYIQDASAAICVYGTGLTVGDNIVVQGTLTDYNGLLEITNPEVSVLSSGNTINPQLMTVAEAVASTNQGWYIRIEDATVTAISGQNTTIAQGTSSIVVRGNLGVTVTTNDVISLNANIGFYNVNQLANPQNVEIQVVTTPVINASDISLLYNATNGEIPYTIDNPVTGTTLAATTTASWVSNIVVTDEKVSFDCTTNDGTEDRTATFTLSYTGAPDKTVTVTQGHYQVDYATLPFSFDGGYADIANTDGLTQEGIDPSDYNSSPKLKFNNTGDWLLLHINEEPGILTFDIKNNSFSGGTFTVQTSEDGVTFTDLENYTSITGTQNEEFDLDANVRYIKWIYTQKVTGNVGLGNITLALPNHNPSITVATPIEVSAAAVDDYVAVTYQNLTITASGDFAVQFCDAAGAPLSEVPDWIDAEVTTKTGEVGYFVYYVIDANTSDARTAYFKVFAMDGTDFVYSNMVTVNQAAYVPPFTGATYTLATTIESGRHYIITNGIDRAMGAQAVNTNGGQGNNRTAVEITKNGNEMQATTAGVVELVITGPDASGNYTIFDGTYNIEDFTGGYLYAVSSSSNHLKTRVFNSNGNSQWSITFDADNKATITAQGSSTRNVMRYNSGSDIFSCYASSTNQNDIYLYLKDETTPQYTYLKEVAGYGNSDGGYYLIASPIDGIEPANVPGMTEDHYDLFIFDQSQPQEQWRNYKQNEFTALESGKGYLYAHKLDVTLAFTGTPSSVSVVDLAFTSGAPFAGWNLIGNPFDVTAYVNRPFYIMNTDGTGLTAAADGDPIDAMQGIFVCATTTGEQATFTTTAPSSGSKLVLDVNKDRGDFVDRAIVRFDEGQTLPKFMFNDDDTKIYIPQDNQDYAVVSTSHSNVVPVSFKAAENGTYTLDLQFDNVEMDYLHLVDNMTGTDVDLLQNPSYTFEANTTDNANRFNLVFSVNGVNEENMDNDFGFFSNGNLVIFDVEGEATLQVVDITGRVLSSETFNGSYNKPINAANGVYMLRLINGENVRTQKIVVR